MKSIAPCAVSLLLLLTVASAASAEPQVKRFYGYGYDLQTGKYLYTEVYRQDLDAQGHWISGHTGYYDAAGKKLGEKALNFSSDRYIPVYTETLTGVGYAEGISQVTPDKVMMFKQSRGKDRQSGSVPRAQPMAADSGFDNYLDDHMQELAAGKTLKFQFGVAGQLDSYSFRASKTGDTQFEGKPAIQVKVEPDSLLHFLVDPLNLTYDPQSGRLLEYRGISNVINPATGKPYNIRMSYFSKAPDDAPKNLPPLD